MLKRTFKVSFHTTDHVTESIEECAQNIIEMLNSLPVPEMGDTFTISDIIIEHVSDEEKND